MSDEEIMRYLLLVIFFSLCPGVWRDGVGAQPSIKTAANSRSLFRPIIMIDPGHGGRDLGAIAPSKPEDQEKNFNLLTARLLEGFLRQKGYRTVMTRSDDTFISLEDRVKASKEAKAKLFISVHYNSAPNAKAEGIEVFYFESSKERERSKKSKILAQAILDSIIAETHALSRGVKHGNFAVIRNNHSPAILIEGGFMTNSHEIARIKDPAYLKKLAWGVAEGIDTFIRQQ